MPGAEGKLWKLGVKLRENLAVYTNSFDLLLALSSGLFSILFIGLNIFFLLAESSMQSSIFSG